MFQKILMLKFGAEVTEEGKPEISKLFGRLWFPFSLILYDLRSFMVIKHCTPQAISTGVAKFGRTR